MASFEDLTELELNILQLLAEGYSKTALEYQLSLSRATLYRHLETIRHKLQAENNAHLITLAVKQGWVNFKKGPVQAPEKIRSGHGYRFFPHNLTKREQQIFMLLGDVLMSEKTTRQLARQLHITEGTLKKHLYHIYQKLGVPNRSSAALLAAQAKHFNAGAITDFPEPRRVADAI
jgi:DNA-binding CsgD family transcriptional regulator